MRISAVLLICVAALGCASASQKAQFRWGENLSQIQRRETNRLGTEPTGVFTSAADLRTLVFKDRFLGAQCLVAYWFDVDSLQFVSYSCSNPDWDENELQSRVNSRLSELYGEPQQLSIGARKYRRFIAPEGRVYFSMVRIPQNRELWRTFQANIFFAHYPHEDYPQLRAVLSSFGSF
ncbi:MAG: hypothetical protein U1F27_09985 [Turneriella sp.]